MYCTFTILVIPTDLWSITATRSQLEPTIKMRVEGCHKILPKLTGPVSEKTDVTPLLTAVILKLYVLPAVRSLMMVEVSFVIMLLQDSDLRQ